MKKRKHAVNFYIGLGLVVFVTLVVLCGIIATPYDANGMNEAAMNEGPSLSHWFGTDNFGRDILSRVMKGAGTTFFVAICTVLFGGIIGTFIGAATGYYGGVVDEIIMRINDGIASFPGILLALILVSIVGTGKYPVILALGILFIPSFARVVRSEFLKMKNMDYVRNARLLGAGDFRIMFVHMLPNAKTILLSTTGIAFNNAVLAESGMSYLGLGVQPPDASLGRMLSEAQSYLMSAPWYALAPGIMIIITVLGFYLVAEDLEEV